MTSSSRRAIRRAPYRPTRPVYPSFRDFTSSIREHQLFINTSELGVRLLVESATAASDQRDSFLRTTYERLKIPGIDHDLVVALGLSGAHYVVATFHVLEGFFTALGREYRTIKRIDEWKDRDNKGQLSALEAILANMPPASRSVPLGMPELEVVRYYAAVRHAVVHHLEPRRAALMLSRLLTEHEPYLRRIYDRLDAPNDPLALKYDDHQLLLHAGKRLAASLNDACELTLVEVLDLVTAEPELMRGLLKRRNSAGYVAARGAAVARDFGLFGVEVSTFCSRLGEVVASMPTHRQRKRERFKRRDA